MALGKTGSATLLALSVLSTLWSCGSPKSETPDTPLHCDKKCAQWLDAACSPDEVTNCIGKCGDVSSHLTLTNCTDAQVEWATCFNAHSAPVCDIDEPTECASQMDALVTCFVCAGDPSGCSGCRGEQCCGESKAYWLSRLSDVHETCREACSDQDCVTACNAAYPEAGAGWTALDACSTTSCQGKCPAFL